MKNAPNYENLRQLLGELIDQMAETPGLPQGWYGNMWNLLVGAVPLYLYDEDYNERNGEERWQCGKCEKELGESLGNDMGEPLLEHSRRCDRYVPVPPKSEPKTHPDMTPPNPDLMPQPTKHDIKEFVSPSSDIVNSPLEVLFGKIGYYCCDPTDDTHHLCPGHVEDTNRVCRCSCHKPQEGKPDIDGCNVCQMKWDGYSVKECPNRLNHTKPTTKQELIEELGGLQTSISTEKGGWATFHTNWIAYIIGKVEALKLQDR